jgi:hypothetical protein
MDGISGECSAQILYGREGEKRYLSDAWTSIILFSNDTRYLTRWSFRNVLKWQKRIEFNISRFSEAKSIIRVSTCIL